MRSIFAKVLVWSLATFALSLVAYWALARVLERRGPGEGDPFRRVNAMVQDDLCHAYEEGGADRLAEALRRLDSYLPGEHILTDDRGRDLVSGADRSDLLKHGPPSSGPPRMPDGRLIRIPPRRRGSDHYRYITLVRPWFGPPNILPYYGAVVLVIAGMGAALAIHLAGPLRRLRSVMDRFGSGDLAARVHSTRRDEIGELARAFDLMAGRIETLLAAERRLLQDVSHELRSPLTRLDVAVELASTSDDPKRSLDRIKRDIARLSVLVSELLQLTRAEGDPTALEMEEVCLDDLVRGLVEDCALEAVPKACTLHLHLGPPCSVQGEHELLRRAIENVVRNAIRHAPEGTGIEVTTSSSAASPSPSSSSSPSAAIAIRDHGPGVPDELLGSIFEPFFRVDGHRSRESGGVGLGLAIARRAVELHGGRITARNASPGLVVTIELPDARPGAPCGSEH
jgi:two-component system sensor histidine kinase CpxA